MTHYASQELIDRAVEYVKRNRFCGGITPEPAIEIVCDIAKAESLPEPRASSALLEAAKAVFDYLDPKRDGLPALDALVTCLHKAIEAEEARGASEVDQLRKERDEATKRADGLRSDVAYWQNIVESAVRACASPGLLHSELVPHIEQLRKDRDEAKAGVDSENPTLLAVCEALGADVDSVEAQAGMLFDRARRLGIEQKELQARNDRQVQMLLAREAEMESISGELEGLKQSIYDHLRYEDANDERGVDDAELSPAECVEAAGDEILRLLARAEKAEAESEDLRSKVDKLNRVADTMAEMAVLSLRRATDG